MREVNSLQTIEKTRFKKAFKVILILLLVSPIFGVYLADLVGYHEPLDVVAEKFGLNETQTYETPFTDYTFPSLPDWLGYILSGLIGVLLILAIGYIPILIKSHRG